ncbi:restriction endonuclease subunit S [Enterobacter quasihormaechei]|uniref:restriction endonuclease subunit S n=1 Tax=Enterobacter quasihormaechei TaxID=2529382 RepID=UPI002F410781
MGSKWVHAKLGDYIHSNLGKMLDQNKNKGDFQPYLGNSNVRWGYFDLEDLSLMKFEEHESDRYGIRKGDLIICEGGEPGRCAIWEDDVPNMKIQKALHRVRPLPGLTSEYLYYWFLYFGRTGQLDAYFTGTTIKHLTGKALAELPIKIPTVDEQKYISVVLGSLDAKIKANRKINQTLEQMSQTLFKSWFVDFDPVIDNALDAGNPIPEALQSRAELRQKVRNSADFKPLPADIRAMFPAEFEETELGWVPKGWSVTELGQLVTVKRGGSPRPIHDFLRADGLPWVKISDATASSSRFLMSTKEFIKIEGLNKTVLLKKGNLILSNSATPGLPKFLDIEACIHDGWLYFPEKGKLTDVYLYNLFLEIKERLISQGNGSVFTNLKTDILKQFKITVPGEDIISYFDKRGTELHKKILYITKNTETLIALRDTLLPKLISGELSLEDLPDIIKQTEAA